jgi:outer membrane protein assembly factor BamA
MKTSYKFVTLIITISFLFVSCGPTKYLKKNEYIINNVKIKTDNSAISKSKLKGISKTIGLKKIFGIALRARIYNIPNPQKDKIREQKKKQKITQKNKKKFDKFDKETNKLRKKRNLAFNRQERLKKSNRKKAYKKAYKKYLNLDEKYSYRKKHAQEIKDEIKIKDYTTWYDFLHKIGQKPQVYDTNLVNITKSQFEIYLKNLGFFNAEITSKADTNGRRINLTYDIKAGVPLKIGSIAYKLPKEQRIVDLFRASDLRLSKGKRININELEKYRNKVATFYRNNGYYFFTSQLISYQIDTTGKYSHAHLTVIFKDSVNKAVYQPWYLRNIYIFNDYDPNFALQDKNKYFSDVDTTPKTDSNFNYFFLTKNNIIIKPKYLLKEIYLIPDSLYSLKLTQNTYSHLSKFKIYKLTNIEYFPEIDTINNKNYLDCNISLSPDNKTNLIFEIEATNSALNNGGAANITFSHNNLFKGGEIFDTKFELALQRQKTFDTTKTGFFNTQEYNFDLKLTIPRLLMPLFQNNDFIRHNNPRTIFTSSLSYQDRPEYNKFEGQLNWDYYMKSSVFSSLIFTPVHFSSIRVKDIKPDFQAWIERAMLQESYENHFIFGSRMTYTFSNQGQKGNNFFVQSNISLAGNSLYALMKATNADTVGSFYLFPFFKTQFAQFAKADVDFRYYMYSSDKEEQLVLRFFAGVGVPYGNSNLLPFSEKYFVGGANSIRAWQARALGPGEYVQPEEYKYINQTGDIKLEANIEYRFKIISIINGAYFLDIGNIWSINSYDSRIGSIFFIDQFYKQLAVGTGFGIRFDINYFVFRTDLGIKVFDPAMTEGERFILFYRPYTLQDINLNFGIGYPF